MRWLINRLPRFMLAVQRTRPQIMLGMTVTFDPVTATLHLHLIWVHVVILLTTLRPNEFYCGDCREVHAVEEEEEANVRPV